MIGVYKPSRVGHLSLKTNQSHTKPLLRKGLFLCPLNITHPKPSGYTTILSKDCKKETDILKGYGGGEYGK